jgi:hypothetical protein
MLVEGLVLYTEDGDALSHRLPSSLGACGLVRRPATLEDVFLKLTGRSLDG